MQDFETKKERILDATLCIIAKNNNSDVTIRDVAREAGVNVAAINYYFKTKEQLLMEVDELFYNNFAEAFSVLDEEYGECERQLIDWLNNCVKYAVHYPGIMVMLRDKMSMEASGAHPVDLGAVLQVYLEKAMRLFVEVTGSKNPKTDFLTFGSAVLFPAMLEQWKIMGDLSPDLSTDDAVRAHIKYVINFYKTISEVNYGKIGS